MNKNSLNDLGDYQPEGHPPFNKLEVDHTALDIQIPKCNKLILTTWIEVKSKRVVKCLLSCS